jgi:hypothetical protein
VLRPSGEGTEVVFKLQFPKMKGFLAVLAPIAFATMGKPDTRKRMQLLKSKIEG